jgi:hypothetical protein
MLLVSLIAGLLLVIWSQVACILPALDSNLNTWLNSIRIEDRFSWGGLFIMSPVLCHIISLPLLGFARNLDAWMKPLYVWLAIYFGLTVLVIMMTFIVKVDLDKYASLGILGIINLLYAVQILLIRNFD